MSARTEAFTIERSLPSQAALGRPDDIHISNGLDHIYEIRDPLIAKISCQTASVLGLSSVGSCSANQDDAADLIDPEIGDIHSGASEHGGEVDRLRLRAGRGRNERDGE